MTAIDPAQAPDAARTGAVPRSRRWRRLLASSPAYMTGVLLVLVLVFSIAAPDSFPTPVTLRNLLTDMAVLLVMAVGMTFVLVAAGFDISIGSVLVFSGVCAAKVMESTGGQGAGTVLLGAAVALLAGAAWGAVNGLVISRLGVPALITTLGSMGAALGAALLISNGTDVRTVPKAMISVATDRPLGVSWLVWVAALVALIGWFVLSQSLFGRHT